MFLHVCPLTQAPVTQRTSVLLHYDVVACSIDTVVIQVSHAVLETELFKTRNLSEDIVQNTPVINRLGQSHFLDSDSLWLSHTRRNLIDNTVSAFRQFYPSLPVSVQLEVEKRRAQQLQQSLACELRISTFHLLEQARHNVLVLLVAQMEMQ